MRLDDRVCSGLFAMEQGVRQGGVLASLLFNIVFCGGYKRDLNAVEGGQRHHGRFGAPDEKK